MADSFELGPNDAALIIREDLSQEVLVPNGKPNEPVTDSTMVILAFALVANNEELSKLLVENLDRLMGELEEDDGEMAEPG